MNLGHSIRSGVKWLFVGNTGGQVLHFLFGIALARLLVPADFGMIATLHVFTGFVGIVASGGMGQSLIRAKEVGADEFDAVFTMQLGLGIVIYAAFFAAAPWIASYFENPLYADLLRVSALSFVMRPFSFIRISWLSRAMLFKRRTQVNLATGVVTGIASVAMAAGGLGVWSLVLAGLLGGLVSNVLFAFITPLRLRLNVKREIMRKHAAYGFKITAGDVLKHLKDEAINLIVSKVAGPAFLGYFSKAESLARMPNKLVTPATGQVVFRAMSKVQDDKDQTKYMFHRTITLLMVYILPCLSGLWWVAEPFVYLVYGEKWLPVVEPLRIILVAGFFRIVMISSGMVLAAQDRLTQELVGEGAGLLVSLAACYVGLRWGLAGVAWGLVGSTVFQCAYKYVLVYRTLTIRATQLVAAVSPALLLNAWLWAVLAATGFALGKFGHSGHMLYLSIMVPIGGVAYAVAFLFLPIPALKTEAARWTSRLAGFAKRSGRKPD